MTGIDGNEDKLAAMVREITELRDILFVMGKGPQAVMEGWVDPHEVKVDLHGDWLGVESKLWHTHLHLSEVAELRFVEEPDPHDPRRRAFSVRLLGGDGQPLLMIFFGRMYDESGVLVADRVARFHALKQRHTL